ncbi:MAG: Sua5/YciO/YrdC/YwlC family protein, partial [Candidatus Aenigmarchaeota archaeon]|nr:Sua5/YciO/YrdC/YwlC family protein [Candidatus Aenigmarchaeota archaeon]
MKIDLENPQSIDIQQATKVLQQGGVIVGPSETCYGLNADATNQLAIKKIFQIKHRP